ncbi:MAG: NADH-quinone oxidoreductase subunit N [Kiritimatiellia bacterium]
MNWPLVFTATLPENILLLGILVLVGFEIVQQRPRGAQALSLMAVIAAAGVAGWLGLGGYGGAPFPGHFSVNPSELLAKAAVLAMVIPVILICRDDFPDSGPFYPLLLSSLYGFCLLLSADSFLTLFLGVEIMSLPVYVLVLLAFKRKESIEAALKYLVLGGTATAMLLMGASLLYGSTGSMSLSAFAQAAGSADSLAITGVVLVFVALYIKAAIAPFHAWAPDAYEAATLPVTAHMAVVIKAGVMLAALRTFGAAALSPVLAGVLILPPLMSIVWGNLAAMKQTGFRRMVAYSSIAHAGYLFYAFLGAGPGRFQAIVFYLLSYGVMNLLAFAAIPSCPDDARRDSLDRLKGLYQRDPRAALLIALAMLSLAGLPPLPGFIGKFLIFRNVMAAGHTLVAVLGLVGSYLGIYFYLRVIQFMFMSPSADASDAPVPRRPVVWAMLLCLAAAISLAVFPGWFLGLV